MLDPQTWTMHVLQTFHRVFHRAFLDLGSENLSILPDVLKNSQRSSPSVEPHVCSGDNAGAGGGGRASGPRTLMSFKGCPLALGCTIVLKGSSPEELARVKKVMQVTRSQRVEKECCASWGIQPHFRQKYRQLLL